MKSADYLKDLRSKSISDLKLEARRIADELMKVSFQRATQRAGAGQQYSLMRRNLARVFTVLSAKQKEENTK